MPWKEESTMSLKEEFVTRALTENVSFSALCREYKVTRRTGYKLIKRYEEEGLSGLAPRSKRPLTHPNQTNLKAEEAIVKLRQERPTWGPKKILKYLSKKKIEHLPSASTANLILKRHNLITIEESFKRKKLTRFERAHPNDLWQMDFKGHFQLLTKKTCYPLTMIDDHSRFALSIQACANEQHLTVKNQLIYIFEKYGLPNQINVDNGNPWGNSHLSRYTQLSLWLMRLGIRVSHSRPRHPQTNGKCERFHRTLKEDVISRQLMRSFSHAQSIFDKYRCDYNHERPHEAIDMDVPANRYQESKKQFPNELPNIEYGSDCILRKARGNGYISYNNKEYLVGEVFKGSLIEVKHDEVENQIKLYYGPFKIYNYDY
jgi:transposase InsO family protein